MHATENSTPFHHPAQLQQLALLPSPPSFPAAEAVSLPRDGLCICLIIFVFLSPLPELPMSVAHSFALLFASF
jgi:hypothetical protein